MSKKIIFILMGIIFFTGFNFTYASGLIINEIMYAPQNGSNYEWVEIYNSGNTPIDLDGYRFFHGEDNSGPITLRNGSTSVLQPLGYAIIAKSPSVVSDYNWLNYSGVIFSASTLSLPDNNITSDTYIAISDSNKIIQDSIKYDTSLGGNKENNASLSKLDSDWGNGIPTPGSINSSLNNSDQNTDNTNTGDDENTDTDAGNNSTTNTSKNSSNTKTKATIIPSIKTKITAKSLSIAGLPVEFQANTTGLLGEPLFLGKYFWNFGDGDSKEVTVNQTAKFTHTYFYPGDYNVTLEYYSNYYSEIPEASDKFTIKVIQSDIMISSVGNEKDFFIELLNNSNYDTDISKWILSSANNNFTFSRNTILPPKKKIIFSSHVTNFTISDKDTLKVLNPNREVVFDYSASLVPSVKTNTQATPMYHAPMPEKISKSEIPKENILENTEIPPTDLASSVVESGQGDNSKDFFFYLGLASFLGIMGGAVYFIRSRRRLPVTEDGNDFQILDE